MTVPTTSPRLQFAGDGVSTQFPFPYVFIEAADIRVILCDSEGVATISALNGGAAYDHTVTGTQDAASGEYLAGGTIVFNTAPPAGRTVNLFRDPALDQDLALIAGGKFAAEPINTQFDKLTMLAQASWDRAGRAITAPVCDPPPPANPSMLLPIARKRAGGILGFDSLGQPVVGGSFALLQTLLGTDWEPSLSEISWVASVTALRALVPPGGLAAVLLLGYNEAGDKAPVIYLYDTTDTRADDGGLVLKPDAVDPGNPGRWVLQAGQRLNVLDWGADPTNTTASDAQFEAWFAAVLATTGCGYIPSGRYKFADAAYWDLSSVPANGVDIIGDGVGRTILDFTAAAASPNLRIGAAGAAFYGSFRDFGLIGDIAATVLEIGHDDFSDQCGQWEFNLNVSNQDTSLSANAITLNWVQAARGSLYAKAVGGDAALVVRQAIGCQLELTVDGGSEVPSYGMRLGGTSYGNVFGMQVALGDVCVQIESAEVANNVFLGGTYIATGAACIFAGAAGPYNRFVEGNYSGFSVVAGVDADQILIDNEPPGNTGSDTETAAGAGNAVKVDTTFTGGLGSTAYSLGDVVWALKTAGLIQP